MQIRRYTKADIPDMLRYLKAGLEQFHYKNIDFSGTKVQQILEGNVNNKAFFCNIVEDDGVVAGALCASCVEFMFSREVFAQDHITYIREGHRSLAAITALVRSYVVWAKERRVRQVRWSQSTGFKIEKFAVLAKRLGFEQIGTHFSMEIGA